MYKKGWGEETLWIWSGSGKSLGGTDLGSETTVAANDAHVTVARGGRFVTGANAEGACNALLLFGPALRALQRKEHVWLRPTAGNGSQATAVVPTSRRDAFSVISTPPAESALEGIHARF
jgi:hypothetical protein